MQNLASIFDVSRFDALFRNEATGRKSETCTGSAVMTLYVVPVIALF